MAAALAAATIACTARGPSAVRIDPPPSPGAVTESVCRRFGVSLPLSLGEGLDFRPVEPEAPGAAAYGSPPVVVRCGVPPVRREPGDTSTVEVVGARFYPVQVDGAVVWTTVDQPVAVEVRIPERYEGQILARLVPLITAAQA